MKERPILFSGPMVRAILAGTKTQTRRVVKDTGLYAIEDHHGADTAKRERVALATRCPYGQPGDRLWVREAWRIIGGTVPDDTLDMFDRSDIQYRADDDQGYIDKYRPSIHMPRRFSRIDLEITAVRVDRLQDISEADCIAEGIDERANAGPDPARWRMYDRSDHYTSSPVESYATLWESINGAGSWAANPWVWVVEFRRVEGGGT